jgi:hypothetical protein
MERMEGVFEVRDGGGKFRIRGRRGGIVGGGAARRLMGGEEVEDVVLWEVEGRCGDRVEGRFARCFGVVNRRRQI